jgi:hypothetical protein
MFTCYEVIELEVDQAPSMDENEGQSDCDAECTFGMCKNKCTKAKGHPAPHYCSAHGNF